MRALVLRGRADFVARRRIYEILILIYLLCIYIYIYLIFCSCFTKMICFVDTLMILMMFFI